MVGKQDAHHLSVNETKDGWGSVKYMKKKTALEGAHFE